VLLDDRVNAPVRLLFCRRSEANPSNGSPGRTFLISALCSRISISKERIAEGVEAGVHSALQLLPPTSESKKDEKHIFRRPHARVQFLREYYAQVLIHLSSDAASFRAAETRGTVSSSTTSVVISLEVE